MQDKDNKTLTNSDLANFYGTDQWYRHVLGIHYTDGIKYMAERAGAYWLIDIVASVQHLLRGEKFQRWILKVDLEKRSAVITCENEWANLLYTQEIPYTDFPLAEIKFYLKDSILLLPSED